MKNVSVLFFMICALSVTQVFPSARYMNDCVKAGLRARQKSNKEAIHTTDYVESDVFCYKEDTSRGSAGIKVDRFREKLKKQK